jgi:hypothetical protein
VGHPLVAVLYCTVCSLRSCLDRLFLASNFTSPLDLRGKLVIGAGASISVFTGVIAQCNLSQVTLVVDSPCSTGQFFDAAAQVCTPYTECSVGAHVVSEPRFSRDRLCGNCSGVTECVFIILFVMSAQKV